MVWRRLAAAALGLALWAAPALADLPVRTENVTAQLHSSRAAVAPGETVTVALRLKVRPEWHTYWRNSGDSGLPTTLDWTLPAGVTAGDIQWPLPKPLPFGPLMNYGYDGETLYPVAITVPASAKPGETLDLAAQAEWLVCKDICIQEGAALALTLPVAAKGAPDPEWAKPIAAAVKALPGPAPEITARLTAAGEVVKLSATGVPLAAVKSLANPYFFPFDGTIIDHAKPQNPSVGAAGVTVELTSGAAGTLGKEKLAGLLVADTLEAGQTVRRGWEIEATPGDALPGAAGAASRGDGGSGTGNLTLPLALFFAFLGGLILNIMPCVFPVLSLKAMSLAKGADAASAQKQGLLFLAGVMATFLALAAALIGLQAAGQAVGWGFQLQEPLFVAGLALLFFVIGLNLLGAFEFGGGLQNAGASLVAKGGNAGAFFTGALAVVAATPCTAPFMGAAMGFAATQPPAANLAVFAALGLGFAAPMTALAFIPAVRNALPKPGKWMETAKQFFAFPMFATAVWLAWVLAAQAGEMGVLALLSLAVAIGFAIWAQRALKPQLRWALAAPLLIATLFLGGRALIDARPAQAGVAEAPVGAGPVYEAWSPTRLAELRAAGTPVFVNFTADWCITCKVNERVALSGARLKAAFEGKGIVYLKGDWTIRDSVIAAELAAHGRNGVPLYLYYPPDGGAGEVLPQLLTEDIVLDAIAKTEGA
jgi:thiol:disulfide interchange protein DsbD